MSRAVLALFVIGIASPALADGDDGRAEKGTLGAGIIIGEPTGVTAKLYVKDDQALQAAVGFAFIGGGIHAHADYVFHPLVLQSRDSFVLLAPRAHGEYVASRLPNARFELLEGGGHLLDEEWGVVLDWLRSGSRSGAGQAGTSAS